MNLKPLTYALAAAGLVAAGTSGAFSLNPQKWLAKDAPATSVAQANTSAQPVTAPAPVAPLPEGATPK